jgi:O-antigen ligase
MVLTGTRAAMLGLAAGVLVWLYLRGFRLTRRMIAGAVAVALLGAAFYFSPPGWSLRSRTRWFTEDRLGGGRPELWRDTLRMARRRLAAGYGPETFTAGFARFESPGLAAAYPDFEYESPHNMFLDALTAQGIPGLAALVALCAAGLMAALRARNAESPYLAAALTAGLVSQQFTGFTIPTAVIVYTTIGLACCRPQMSLASPAPDGTRPATFEWAAAKLKHGLPLALALALLYCAVRLTVADAALARAQRALNTGDATAAAAQY